MLRNRFITVCLPLLAAATAAGAQTPVPQDTTARVVSEWFGSWTARTSSDRTFAGSWTAAVNANGTVMGTWILQDAAGAQLASGAWSAAKTPTRWTGGWRAIMAGRDGEFSGTWTADVDLRASGSFTELFEKAATAVVNGSWRAGAQSGAWAIRALRKKAEADSASPPNAPPFLTASARKRAPRG